MLNPLFIYSKISCTNFELSKLRNGNKQKTRPNLVFLPNYVTYFTVFPQEGQ